MKRAPYLFFLLLLLLLAADAANTRDRLLRTRPACRHVVVPAWVYRLLIARSVFNPCLLFVASFPRWPIGSEALVLRHTLCSVHVLLWRESYFELGQREGRQAGSRQSTATSRGPEKAGKGDG